MPASRNGSAWKLDPSLGLLIRSLADPPVWSHTWSLWRGDSTGSQQTLSVNGVELESQPIGQAITVSGSSLNDTISLSDSSELNVSVDGKGEIDRLIPQSDGQTIDLVSRLAIGRDR